MANSNKDVKVLNIKSAVSLQLTAIEKQNVVFEILSNVYRMHCLECAGPEINCQLLANVILKKTIKTFLKLAIDTKFWV